MELVMTSMMEALRLEHANIAKLLDLLECELAEEALADFSLIKLVADYFGTYPDQYHHPKEDLLYHALLEAEPEIGASLDDLEAEHLELADRTGEFALAVERILNGDVTYGQWFNELVGSLIRYYRHHMAKEETSFFLEAERVLDPTVLQELESKVDDASDPIFDPYGSDRLARLRAHVGESN
jgi:hemerythrin-like domain-containing protein